MLVVLLTVLIASQVSFAIPFSYVATPMFGACNHKSTQIKQPSN